ncbi:Vacuolar basic amino acid transporter 3 [Penicillium soppii]|uniref:Vacuolar basic amino acid transporter 3 n=1 Tax=Penicillium soppii TaxID=69789 RepID=UPI00254995B3|nr:Vacuolar basic amino acid transporter 3 [Penicillium soppii]KAJ5864577.1 Vacuolar basic amino acid transporter 3 [Penicillium soppii]
MDQCEERPDTVLEIAIIGGGIAGITAALGIRSKSISCKVYERATEFREIGAGIGLSPNAERAMLLLDQRIHAAFKRLATPNTEDWFQYVDGFNKSPDGDGEEPLFKIYLGERGFEGCRRTDFLDALAKMVPDDRIEFNKDLVKIIEPDWNNGKVELCFADGSTSKADVVLGCDGLRSRAREYILGVDHPATRPSYTHKFAFRGVIPMEKAIQAIGETKSLTRYMHLGAGCHVLTYPVAMCTMLNVVAFVTDAGDWPSHEKLTFPATKREVFEYFTNFGPVVTAILNLLDDKLDKWGIFDLHENPAPAYISKRGRVCLVGDAAHAAAPHHGAGAGLAFEDVLALAVALEEAVGMTSRKHDPIEREEAFCAALSSYEAVRYERTQWLVESSRFMGELFEWQTECNMDPIKCHSEAERRSHLIWDYDIDYMIKEVQEVMKLKLM